MRVNSSDRRGECSTMGRILSSDGEGAESPSYSSDLEGQERELTSGLELGGPRPLWELKRSCLMLSAVPVGPCPR